MTHVYLCPFTKCFKALIFVSQIHKLSRFSRTRGNPLQPFLLYFGRRSTWQFSRALLHMVRYASGIGYASAIGYASWCRGAGEWGREHGKWCDEVSCSFKHTHTHWAPWTRRVRPTAETTLWSAGAEIRCSASRTTFLWCVALSVLTLARPREEM